VDGLHILANLYRCAGEPRYLTDRAALRDLCLAAVERAGLTALGELFHQFDGGGATGCIVLAESHVAIHTWPEFATVTLDAFVCNYSRDNTACARGLVDELVTAFRPEDVVRHEVRRDLAATAPLRRAAG
jgi:S-adenosylmethionine decarboxylase proenzyme